MQQHSDQWPRKWGTTAVQLAENFAHTAYCQWLRQDDEQYGPRSDTVGGPTPCAEVRSIETQLQNIESRAHRGHVPLGVDIGLEH
eukprot:3055847-Pyramimonas_sp.AAC.1